jgi:hypothetical protein
LQSRTNDSAVQGGVTNASYRSRIASAAHSSGPRRCAPLAGASSIVRPVIRCSFRHAVPPSLPDHSACCLDTINHVQLDTLWRPKDTGQHTGARGEPPCHQSDRCSSCLRH